ncbi:VOC family protein [Chloroflexota bacterium]
MKIEHIDHIHIAVRDLDAAVSFFEDILGIKFGKEYISEELQVKCRIAPAGHVALELLQGTSEDSYYTKFVESRGEGVQAISFKVPDIDEAVEELEAKGVRVTERIELPLLREAECHHKDAHGVQIELCQYDAGHPMGFALQEKTTT